MRAALAVLLLSGMGLSGCTALDDLWSSVQRPDLDVQRSALALDGWNTDPRFIVVVNEAVPAHVVIEAISEDGHRIVQEGDLAAGDQLVLVLPDGVWDITYTVDGHTWEALKGIRIDSTPPVVRGLERNGHAQNGSYTLGTDAQVEPGASIEVRHAGVLIATSLPHRIDGITGPVILNITITDAAGNEFFRPVEVTIGDALPLPEGTLDFGIVARYRNEARLWDLSDMQAYATPSEAAVAAGGWLGSGHGVDPADPLVQQVVFEVGTGSTTMEIAWNLYRWLFDNLEYDDARLESTTLMLPHQVLGDLEDPDAETSASQDAGDDGLADDGAGNGVRGGVCRDLAATYVSLLRAAGIPARLVSGYLAGSVQGFHAWVEFYGGDVAGNPGPWIPVDVSPIDGVWEDGEVPPRGIVWAMQSFGVALPEYLALRDLDTEEPGWSTALSTRYSYPPSSGEPVISFKKQVTVRNEQTGWLCFDAKTLVRAIRSADTCPLQRFPGFVLYAEQVIDYGIAVEHAGPGTEVTASLSHPSAASVAPDLVEWFAYGHSHEQAGGRVTATFLA